MGYKVKPTHEQRLAVIDEMFKQLPNGNKIVIERIEDSDTMAYKAYSTNNHSPESQTVILIRKQ